MHILRCIEISLYDVVFHCLLSFSLLFFGAIDRLIIVCHNNCVLLKRPGKRRKLMPDKITRSLMIGVFAFSIGGLDLGFIHSRSRGESNGVILYGKSLVHILAKCDAVPGKIR